jgi:hypothetical protein
MRGQIEKSYSTLVGGRSRPAPDNSTGMYPRKPRLQSEALQ